MSKFKIKPAVYTELDEFEEKRVPLDWFINEVAVFFNGSQICRLQQGVGHCCGSTFITQMSQYYFKENLDDLLSELRKAPHVSGLRWKIQKNLFLYLSDETAQFDAEIRARKDIKELYSFMNNATRPYTPSKVSLFVLEL